jgi:hypothetical protein
MWWKRRRSRHTYRFPGACGENGGGLAIHIDSLVHVVETGGLAIHIDSLVHVVETGGLAIHIDSLVHVVETGGLAIHIDSLMRLVQTDLSNRSPLLPFRAKWHAVVSHSIFLPLRPRM